MDKMFQKEKLMVPPNLAYRVIKDGESVYVRDGADGQLVDFKVRTLDWYFDFQPVQRLFCISEFKSPT